MNEDIVFRHCFFDGRGAWSGGIKARYNSTMTQHQDRLARGVYTRYQPIYNEFGFTKGALDSDQTDDDPFWTVGMYPAIFPYHLVNGGTPGGRAGIRRSYQIGVPVDDTTTWHFQYFCYVFPPEVEVPQQEVVPYTEVPLKDEKGEYILDCVLPQDMVGWWAQGNITDKDAVLWKYDDGTPYVPSALLVDDMLYFYRSNSGILTTLGAGPSGEPPDVSGDSAWALAACVGI